MGGNSGQKTRGRVCSVSRFGRSRDSENCFRCVRDASMSSRPEDLEGLLKEVRVEDQEVAREGFESGMANKAIKQMCTQAEMLRELRCPNGIGPSAGFTARVMARIDAERPATIWDLFVSPVLAKQLVFASLVLMAMLAGFMVARTSDRAVLSQHTERTLIRVEHPVDIGVDPRRDRQNMLATLASYQGGN
jgi:hypothetical protein